MRLFLFPWCPECLRDIVGSANMRAGNGVRNERNAVTQCHSLWGRWRVRWEKYRCRWGSSDLGTLTPPFRDPAYLVTVIPSVIHTHSILNKFPDRCQWRASYINTYFWFVSSTFFPSLLSFMFLQWRAWRTRTWLSALNYRRNGRE